MCRVFYRRMVTCILAFVCKYSAGQSRGSFSVSIDRFSAEKVGGILIVSLRGSSRWIRKFLPENGTEIENAKFSESMLFCRSLAVMLRLLFFCMGTKSCLCLSCGKIKHSYYDLINHFLSFINLTRMCVFCSCMAAFISAGETRLLEGVRRVAECLCCRLRPVVGYAMASLRQHSAAPVAGGSSRFCYQTHRVAEHLGVTLFKFMAGTFTTRLGFLPTLAIPFITNEWLCREEAESAPSSTGVLQ